MGTPDQTRVTLADYLGAFPSSDLDYMDEATHLTPEARAWYWRLVSGDVWWRWANAEYPRRVREFHRQLSDCAGLAQKVLELHSPADPDLDPADWVCEGCGDDAEWPCITVRVVSNVIGGTWPLRPQREIGPAPDLPPSKIKVQLLASPYDPV